MINEIPNKSKNSFIIILILFGSFIFQITILRHIWGIENISRIFNFIILLSTSAYASYCLIKLKTTRRVWLAYIIPAWLIIIGTITNISINVLQNFSLLGQFGFALPWVLFLMMPRIVDKGLVNYQILWRYSYYLMLFIVITGLFDYYIIYYSGTSTRVLNTPYGVFLAGKFSILHMIEDGLPHFRFYASFAEPGSLGMMLLPFIFYSFLYKRYLGMFILGLGLYFSHSLGAYISLFFLVILYILFRRKGKTNYVFLILSSTIIIIIAIGYVWPAITEEYEKKGVSRITREESFKRGINALPDLFINHTFGMPLSGTTKEAEQNELYTGTNFIPLVYLQYGGIVSFIGFCIIVCFSIYDALWILSQKKVIDIEDYIVAVSLIAMIPFLFQRMTIWETPLFALLYFPSLLKRELG